MAGPFKGAQIKGMDQVSADMTAFLKEIKKSPIILDDVGMTATNYIRGAVQARREEYAMGPLKPRTEAIRESLSANNPVANTFSPKRSNLTFTGELLQSMIYKIQGAKVVISFQGTHHLLKDKFGRPIGEPKTNAAIAAKLNENPNFHFLFISKRLETTLKNRIVAGIRRQLSVYRKFKTLIK